MPNIIFERMSEPERQARLKRLAEFTVLTILSTLVRAALFDGVSPGLCVVRDGRGRARPGLWLVRGLPRRLIVAAVLAGIIS